MFSHVRYNYTVIIGPTVVWTYAPAVYLSASVTRMSLIRDDPLPDREISCNGYRLIRVTFAEAEMFVRAKVLCDGKKAYKHSR